MTRSGFKKYRKDNPQQRYGQAFCNYFETRGTKMSGALFYEPNEEVAKAACEQLMEDWQVPEH